MEQNRPGFRLRLNLFDAIVILIALAAAAFLLWQRLRPAAPDAAPAAAQIEYTIYLRQTLPGTGERVRPGDALVDAVKNIDLGEVSAVRTAPAVRSIINEAEECYTTAGIPGYEDIYITVRASGSVSESQVLVGGGYAVRVNEAVFVRGPGYLGSGEIYSIERGE